MNKLVDLFKLVIGIEIHTELKTETKMFSPTPNRYGAQPNTLVNEIDLGYPGVMPSPNKKAIELAIILGSALKMNLNTDNICFDRKHYFYPDLPKGFQITQQYFPIGEKGIITISKTDGSKKDILINRIHLEEDSAKTIRIDDKTFIDYNRAGVPLIEIVSEPCINSAEEAMLYISEIKKILQFSGISNAKMEEGSMRCDINISITPKNVNFFGTKVEIKNINSIANVGKAINYELNRQINLVMKNESVVQETRRWDDTTNKTVFMRQKNDSVDYRYITEPNIQPIKLQKEYVSKLISNAPKLPSQIEADLKSNGILEKEALVLLNDYELYEKFIYVAERTKKYKESFTWVVNESLGILFKTKKNLTYLSNEILNNIILIINLIEKGRINGKQAKSVLLRVIENEENVLEIIKSSEYKQVDDPNILESIILNCISENKEMLLQYTERPERVEKFFIGLVMRNTNSQANPIITAELVKKLINNYNK